jgi:tetraacyldisaccharide 4'-kinase
LGADLAVLDDGFQHRQLSRDFDLVLLSPDHPLPPRLLPRGPFREPLSALRRAHLVLVTGKGADGLRDARDFAQAVGQMRRIPPIRVFPLDEGGWQSLDGVPTPAPPGPPFVVTSVALPEAFRRSVARRSSGLAGSLEFSDHHPYSEADAASIGRGAGSAWVATTEKDAVKLSAFRELLPEVRVLPLVPNPPKELEAELLSLLRACLGPDAPR